MTMNRQEKLLQELRRWDETCPGCALCKPLPKRNNSIWKRFCSWFLTLDDEMTESNQDRVNNRDINKAAIISRIK